jgi:hypothetical protein
LLNVYIFSTAGPFYVEKVNAADSLKGQSPQNVALYDVYYDEQLLDLIPASHVCAIVIPAPSTGYLLSFGDIIPVVPHTMTDPNNARAVPAANAIEFTLVYVASTNCPAYLNFASGLTLTFEATVLAPTTATVSICANEARTTLTSCSAS